MSRSLRLEFPDTVYHVTSRGDRREPIYRDERDRIDHLAALEQAMDRFDAQVLAYCLMGNHYHLVRAPAAHTSKGTAGVAGAGHDAGRGTARRLHAPRPHDDGAGAGDGPVGVADQPAGGEGREAKRQDLTLCARWCWRVCAGEVPRGSLGRRAAQPAVARWYPRGIAASSRLV